MNKNTNRHIKSQEQFGRQAHCYTESLAHSSGESLHLIQEWTANDRCNLAVDIGTGAGFTAFAIALHVDRVLATDITLAMLIEARSIAKRRGVTNVIYTLAAAECLPFPDDSMELLTCRTAAHHFHDISKAITEWSRVLASKAILILADTSCPEDSETAAWMNDIEVRRDPSHVQNLSESEWLALLETNGFDVTHIATTQVPLSFDDWVHRSGTSASVAQNLREDFLNAPSGAVRAFNIRPDASGDIRFQWDCIVVKAIRRKR